MLRYCYNFIIVVKQCVSFGHPVNCEAIAQDLYITAQDPAPRFRSHRMTELAINPLDAAADAGENFIADSVTLRRYIIYRLGLIYKLGAGLPSDLRFWNI